MNNTKKISLLLFLLFALLVQAQDSIPLPLKIKRVKYRDEKSILFDANNWKTIDTLIDGMQVFANRNHLGNLGLPLIDRNYSNVLLGEAGFRYANNYFSSQEHTSAKIKYFEAKSPFTELFLCIAAKKEQTFSVIHSQNITRNWNASLKFQRIRSEGFYNKQNTNDNQLTIHSDFQSKNNRYWVMGHIIYNGMNFLQNGGIKNDTLFEAIGNGDKKLLGVNLTGAQTRLRQRRIGVTQGINFGKKQKIKVDTTTINRVNAVSGLIFTTSLEDNAWVYEDKNPTQGFYSNIFNDSTKTLDSVYYYKLENEIGFNTKEKNTNGEKRSLSFYYGLKHEMIQLHQDSLDTLFNNVIAKGEMYTPADWKGFYGNVKAQYVLAGSNAADYWALLNTGKKINSNSALELKIAHKEFTPDFRNQYYAGNNFRWSNNFKKNTDKFISLEYINTKINLNAGAMLRVFQNWNYLDSTVKQFSGDINILSGWVQKNFKLGKFNFNNKIIYQNTNNSSIVRLPQFLLEHSFYYSSWWFKNALYVQLGLDINYYSSYYANGYMPALNEFYVQNKKQIGNYPFFDVFFNMKIKAARVFFKYEHINAGLMGNTYYSTLAYPMPARAFKFGLIWRFFD